ncbi:MAG: hypothetical protein ABIV63_03660 [Caldimonas sp.]
MKNYHTDAEHFFADLSEAAGLIAKGAAGLPADIADEYIESEIDDVRMLIASYADRACDADQRVFVALWRSVGDALREQVSRRRGRAGSTRVRGALRVQRFRRTR